MPDAPAATSARTSPAWRLGILAAAGAVGTSSVAPALPELARALALTDATTAAVVSAYAVPYAAATIVAGQLCDSRGPRLVLRVALSLAVVGGLVAALAPDALVLLLGRALQGTGAGAVTMGAYDVARRTPGGIPATAAVLTLGASAGPLVGGLATELVAWQAAVLLPVLLHASGLLGLSVPDAGGGEHGVDRLGVTATGVFAAVGATALQVAGDLPQLAIGLGAVALAALAVAVRRTLSGRGRVPPAPLLRESDLRRRGALAASIAGTYFASLVVVPVALGRLGYGAIAIGLVLLPPAVSGALAARNTAAIAARLGRATDPLAAVITAVVLTVLLFAPPLAAALSLVGLAAAYGIVQPRLLETVSARVHDGPATAIGTANLVLLLGGGVGAATVGGLGTQRGLTVLLVLVVAVAASVVRASRRPTPQDVGR